MLRAVLDTNVLVSAFLVRHGKPAQILKLPDAAKFQLVLAEEILAEVQEVLGYKHIQKRFHPRSSDVQLFLDALRAASSIVTVEEIENVVSRDPDDNLVVACAVQGDADYLVSGNRHLLDLKRHRTIEIVTPARFLEILDAM
jgi:putative PIN family toxin of toxin-antitoxin system